MMCKTICNPKEEVAHRIAKCRTCLIKIKCRTASFMEDLIGFYELAIKYCDKKSNRKNDKNYIYDETLEMRE